MIAIDTNLLIYAYNSNAPLHAAAKNYWESILHGAEQIGLPVVCVHGFIRLTTGAALGNSRITVREALEIVDSWLTGPHIQVLSPGPDHWHLLKRLSKSQPAGALFSDAVIAAIAIEYDAVLHTNDRDFARFTGLRWHNPLRA